MLLSASFSNSPYTESEEESFKRIITTAKGSRIMRPHFGCDLYELIDRTMDGEFMMLFNRYLLEAFFDENYKPWDDRLVPLSTKIKDIEATKGELECVVEFENSSVVVGMGGFLG
ncbi:hypothetical protein [Sulfurimonas sp.]|uniref:hypothetical protein n=1 Tax=Sulfurimonas sp. TaxID=2022749 RepID=UPI0025E5A613|nr:hypothetical protein [Sulfurimonas sp.]